MAVARTKKPSSKLVVAAAGLLVWGLAGSASAAAPSPAGRPTTAGDKDALPLWPYPQQVRLDGGTCDLGGKAVCVPEQAGEKSLAVADALAQKLGQYLKQPAGPVRRQGAAPKGFYVLSVGAGPESWPPAAGECKLDQVHPTIRGQGYLLKITPAGAVLVSPTARGLSYAAVTLMQLARNAADGNKLACATILDWPDLEERVVLASYAGLPADHRRMAGVLCWEGKLTVLKEAFSVGFERHPELSIRSGRAPGLSPDIQAAVRDIRNLGVELVTGYDMARGHFWERKDNPYVFMQDGEPYFWAMKDVIDEQLELFRPKCYSLGMDEEHFSMRHTSYPNRTLQGWRDVAAELMGHLRRRGVTGMFYTDVMAAQTGGSPPLPWTFGGGKKFPEGYAQFTATFPNDLTMMPWFYWVKSPQEVLDGKGDMGRQARTGLPIMFTADGGNIQYHIAAARMIKQDCPNVLGVISCCWGGSMQLKGTTIPRHPSYVRWAAGPMWNAQTGKDAPAGFKEDPKPGIANWECLLDADPPESVEAALKRLADPAWRTWLGAREELVAAGLPAAPALLAAMSAADGELRDRIEGCLSRNGRDGRAGRRRGALDVAKVLPFLADGNAAVREMAAELLVSCADGAAAELRKKVRDPLAGQACIRALGLVKDKACGKDLIAVLADAAMPAATRSEAARTLGLLKEPAAAGPLTEALRTGKDKEVRKAALWALALAGPPEADTEFVGLLDSADTEFRYRAATALVARASPQIDRLIPWLAKDRDSMEIAAWALYVSRKGRRAQEAKDAYQSAKKTQKDEIARKRLDEWSDAVMGVKKG